MMKMEWEDNIHPGTVTSGYRVRETWCSSLQQLAAMVCRPANGRKESKEGRKNPG